MSLDRPPEDVHAPPADAAPAPPAVSRAGFLGRRRFVTGALVAGTAVGAAAVTQLAGSWGDRVETVGAPTGVTVLAGAGIDPAGTGNSTEALQALVDAAGEGAQLWLPGGLYLVDGLVLRAGQSLTGPPARNYLGAATSGARLRARQASQTEPVLTVGGFGHVADISVEGRDRKQPAIRPADGGTVLERVTLSHGSIGFDAAYVSGHMLTECIVHENGVGMQNLVDSVVQSCFLNANRGDGISLGPGANDNTFLGNKIEWNDGHGIQALQALHNVVIGGVVDRNGRTGARLVECAHSTIVGAVFRRNGRLAERTPDDDCHLYQENCTGLVVSGLSTNSGADDDDVSGYTSPAVALRSAGGADIAVTGNDLSGRTSPVAVARSGEETRHSYVGNVGFPGAQRVRAGSGELTVAAGRSATLEFDVEAAAPGTAGALYRLELAVREATGGRALGDAPLLVFRDAGDAEATLGTVESRLGAAVGTTVVPSVAVTSDGSRLTVTVENLGAGEARVRVELA